MFTILSIDPGTHHLGYALSQVDQNFTVVKWATVEPSRYTGAIKKHRRYFTDRILTGRVISDLITDLVLQYRPDYITSEDAFYNPARPNAFVSLLIAIYAMESALYQFYIDKKWSIMKLYKTPPTLVKKIFSSGSGKGGKSTKDDMYLALQERVAASDILFLNNGICPSIDNFTEHSVDAIGVGYAFYKFWLPLLEAKVLDNKCTSLTKSVRNHLKRIKYYSPYL